jgi:lactobin A/cerein 7B family class IIb bacteriocin
MKNLENYGVQEMNATELSGTDGGFWPAIVVGLVIGAAIEIMGDWEHFKQGLAS